MNRIQVILSVCVAVLSITSVALIVVLATRDGGGAQCQMEAPSAAGVGRKVKAGVKKSEEGKVKRGKLYPWEENLRLPGHIVPHHYDLYLHPNIDTGLFSGSSV